MKTQLGLIGLTFLLVSACGSLSTGSDSGSVSDEGATSPSPDDTGVEDPSGDEPSPPADDSSASIDLTVTVTHPDAAEVVYTVSCGSGTESIDGDVDVDAAVACRALRQSTARERLVDGAPGDRICSQMYGGPDEARIVGSYDANPVDTVINRVDGCGIADWDKLLSGALPRPRG